MRYERYYCTWNIVARSIFECLRFLPRKNKKTVIEDKITFMSQVIIVNRLCYFSYTEFFILRLVNKVISNKYKSQCKQMRLRYLRWKRICQHLMRLSKVLLM